MRNVLKGAGVTRSHGGIRVSTSLRALAACCAVFGAFALSGVTGSASAATGTLAVSSATAGTITLTGTVTEASTDCTSDGTTLDCSWSPEATVVAGTTCPTSESGDQVFYGDTYGDGGAPTGAVPLGFTVDPVDLSAADNVICLYFSPGAGTAKSLIAAAAYDLPQAGGTATVTPGPASTSKPVQFGDTSVQVSETACIAEGCNWQLVMTVQPGKTCSAAPVGKPAFSSGVVSGEDPGEESTIMPPPLTVAKPHGTVSLCAYVADVNLKTPPVLVGSASHTFSPPPTKPSTKASKPHAMGKAPTANNTRAVAAPTKAPRKAVLGKKGQPVKYKTVAGALVKVSLHVPKKVAKKVGLKGTAVGSVKATAPANGNVNLRVVVAKKARHALKHYHKKYKLTIKAKFTSGGSTLTVKTVETVKK